jgi:hypothetical protein
MRSNPNLPDEYSQGDERERAQALDRQQKQEKLPPEKVGERARQRPAQNKICL